MAAVTAPGSGSLLGKFARAAASRAAAKQRPSKVAAFLADHTGTMAALGFADSACWHWGTTAGLIGTAVAILVAEFKIRG